jgi:hypothetical protein
MSSCSEEPTGCATHTHYDRSLYHLRHHATSVMTTLFISRRIYCEGCVTTFAI